MAENLKRKNVEEIEFSEIDAILPSLLEENLITDIECRMIASYGYNQLLEKHGAVHEVIMSKTKEEAAHLTEIFRTLTFHADELLPKMRKTSDCQDEDENNLPEEKPNPLLIKTVLSCLFKYIRLGPLDDIKRSRLVCREWNSAAEICLRERCKIHFRPGSLTPAAFMELSKYSLPDRPFSAYKFSGVDYTMCADQIENFFEKWGQNIEEVELVALDTSHDRIYNITPWIEKTSKLCSLTIQRDENEEETLFSISIDKLATIKTIVLKTCRILTNGDCVTFLPSSNVRLMNTTFESLGNIAKGYFLNDFFDFSQVANLAISNRRPAGVKFNIEGEINKKQLYLNCVDLENLNHAKGDVDLLGLYGCEFIERNDLKITRMIIDNSKVDLCVLPQTLEKLIFGENVDITHRESFDLPNLKYLIFAAESEDSGLLAFLLANLPNLTELLLMDNDDESGITLDLDCIPKNVKKLGIQAISGDMKIEFANSDQVLEIDTLVLDSIEYCKSVLGRIKPKVLVVTCNVLKDEPFIIEIILANKQIGTILLEAAREIEKFPFEGSTFSNYVDKKSKYYKFENQVGHAIEHEEFLDFAVGDGFGDEYFD